MLQPGRVHSLYLCLLAGLAALPLGAQDQQAVEATSRKLVPTAYQCGKAALVQQYYRMFPELRKDAKMVEQVRKHPNKGFDASCDEFEATFHLHPVLMELENHDNGVDNGALISRFVRTSYLCGYAAFAAQVSSSMLALPDLRAADRPWLRDMSQRADQIRSHPWGELTTINCADTERVFGLDPNEPLIHR